MNLLKFTHFLLSSHSVVLTAMAPGSIEVLGDAGVQSHDDEMHRYHRPRATEAAEDSVLRRAG